MKDKVIARYYGPTLPNCDICGAEALYDAKTVQGPWGYLCESHFRSMGVGLGLGKGQKLALVKPNA